MIDPEMRQWTIMCTALALAALLMATPVGAGDYALYNCGSTKVLLSMPDKGEAGFYTYQRNRHGQFTSQKELPRSLFRIKYEGQEMHLYYRGKLCSSDDE